MSYLVLGRTGGHDVPEDTVRRHHSRGLANFFTLYMPLTTTWRFYDNSGRRSRLIAHGKGRTQVIVVHDTLWQQVTEAQHGGERIRSH